MVTVKWSELLDAFEFASFGAPGESRAFVNLDTGSLHCTADGIELEEEDGQWKVTTESWTNAK